MLRIGIDLTALPSMKGGVAFYLVALIEALAEVDPDNSYLLLLRQEHREELAARSPGFQLYPIRLSSRPIRLAWEQLRLPQVVREHRLDVLHSPHYTRPLRRLPCASVVGVMDMTIVLMPELHEWHKRLFFGGMIPAAVRRADRLIAISESTKRDLQRQFGVPSERIDVTPLAVDRAYHPDIPLEEVAEVRRHYSLPEAFILYVGRLEPRKNLPRLLDAYRLIRNRRPDVPPLVLAGAPGWHDAALNDRLVQLGSSVIRLGYVPEKKLPALYAASMLFVYPSLYEGFGIPVLEALSCGVPTVTSRVSSMPEVAGEAALLIDPDDTGALASAIERVLLEPELRRELRSRGLRQSARFSWRATAELTVQSYTRAAEQWSRMHG